MNKESWMRGLVYFSSNRKSKSSRADENPKWVRLIAIVITLAICGTVAHAQQPKNIPRIGLLSALSPSAVSPWVQAFRQGLSDRGFVEGKNILIEYRYAEGKVDHLKELADELVRIKVDVIVTGGALTTSRVKEATSTIPIVMAQDADPVGSGIIASLARPGSNITGLSFMSPEITGKRLELLKETVPGLTRVAVLTAERNPADSETARELQGAARALEVKLQILHGRNPNQIDGAFSAMTKEHAGAFMVITSPVLSENRARILNYAVKTRLAATYPNESWVQSGGLMTYGTNLADLWRRAAVYVDKILKGTKPADLPVEQPTKFDFIINLKAAKQIGLTIPPNVLARADKVIK